MWRIKLSLLIIVLVFNVNTGSAQVYTTGRENKKADINFTELANYYLAHPVSAYRKPLFDEDEEDSDDEYEYEE